MHDDNARLSAADLLELNRDLQGSRAIRLLAATNLSLYATLMERHLSDGAVPETELVVRLERDLDDLDDAQSGLALIKSWASQGWLHRIVDERHDQNVCYLTQDARRALDFLRGMRRQDTIATGGSITGIASRLKQVAVKVDNDPARIRKHIEAEIAALHEELDQLDAGQRPQPDVTDCYDEARAIALQMERLITDIGQYGTMIEQATAALDEPIDTNVEYRDRQRQMYTDYQAAWDSQGRDSHRAFLRMINDPDQRAEFEADVAAVADALPALDPALRKVMAGFFELVGHQIDEVERIQQRCAQRVKRFTAFGTMEQSRGVARQLNEAIDRCMSLFHATDGVVTLMFAKDKWTRYEHGTTRCAADGTAQMTVAAEYPMPQQMDDPIALLTGRGRQTVAAGGACTGGGDFTDKFERTVDLAGALPDVLAGSSLDHALTQVNSTGSDSFSAVA